MPSDNNTFVDSSSNNFALTRFGNTTQGSFSPFTVASGYWNNYFDGSGDYLSISNSSALDLTGGNFTIEAWIYWTGMNQNATIINKDGIFGASLPSYTFELNGSQRLKAGVGTGNSTSSYQEITANTTLTPNTWVHVAFVKNANTLTIYQNGSSVASATQTATMVNGNKSVLIGWHQSQPSSMYFDGYISNLRIVKGTAVYTTNFTPPTTPLTAVSGTSLLTCQSNRLVDNSNNNFTITANGNVSVNQLSPFLELPNGYWSNYFDGSGDYLTVPDSTAFDLPGDFTAEFFVYPVGSKSGALMGLGDYTSPNNGFSIYYASGKMAFYVNDTDIIVGNTSIAINSWSHIAVVRNGSGSNNIKLYVNGVQDGQGSSNVSFTGVAAAGIIIDTDYGGAIGAGKPNTYLSNVRLVKGTAVYTTDFTPPTTPLTAISGTSLLTCQSRSFKDSSSSNLTITPVGNATVNSKNPFSEAIVRNRSIYLDGSGDKITLPAGTQFAYGTGAFTIEAWVNPQPLINPFVTGIVFGQNAFGTNYLCAGLDSSYRPFFTFGTGGGGTSVSSAVAASLNTWSHVAWVREGTGTNQFKMYVNGVLAGTGTVAQNFNDTSAYQPCIGGYAHSTQLDYKGYISNLRVVKGSAVYTDTFTPPTTPLTLISGTSLLTCQSETFKDNSNNALTLTANGNVAVNSYSPFSDPAAGYWSNYFDGTGDYLTVPNNAAFEMGSGDYTLEFWMNATISGDAGLVFKGTYQAGATWQPGFGVRRFSNQALRFYFNTTDSNSTEQFADAGVSTGENTWYHIAMVVNNGTGRAFVNGQQVATRSGITAIAQSNTGITIGRFPYSLANIEFSGFISNVRIVKGTALYTSNFTPSTTPLTAVSGTSLLTCQNKTFIDNSTNAFTVTANGNPGVDALNPFPSVSSASSSSTATTIGNAVYDAAVMGGSIYFDGSGDYLTQTTNAAYGYGTADFTIEFWLNLSSTEVDQTIVSNLTSASSTNPHFYFASSGKRIYYYTANADRITGDVLSPNIWYHIALSRESGSTKLFINGVKSGLTYADTNNYGSTAPLGIGTYWTGDSPFATKTLNGYISNLRIVKGTAVYTANFTPPTAPVSAISGTSLLLNGTNAGIVDLSGKSSIETVGDAKISTSVAPKGSMYFDGTGDYLTAAPNPNYAFGTGDFTIECWINPADVSSATQRGILQTSTSVGGLQASYANGIVIAFGNRLNGAGNSVGNVVPSDGGLAAVVNNTAVASTSTSAVISANQWSHVALVRYNGTLTLYANGISIGSVASSANITAQNLCVGGYYSTAYLYSGYMNDFRVTNGIARYTANFTPPTRSSA